jgi:hypothetical protein
MGNRREIMDTLTIVYDGNTKQAAEFLMMLIGETDNSDIDIDAVLIEADMLKKLPEEKKSARRKFLYIGNFKESREIARNILTWRFNQFGVRYGWLGNKAVINFDSECQYAEMVDFAEKEFAPAGYNLNMCDELKGDWWDEMSKEQKTAAKIGACVVGAGVLALIAATAFGGRSDSPYIILID